MEREDNKQVLLTVACIVFLFLADFRSLLLGGLSRGIAFVVLACLLTFVVLHSSAVRRVFSDSLAALPCPFLAVFDRRWDARSTTAFPLSREPILQALFQRPPPPARW